MRRLLVLVAAVATLWCAPGAFAAGWCGTGESATDRPDVVTGQQIHAIYAIPSNAADDFATGAATLANDVASITAWWQGQDPTHVPRFDLAAFPTGTCLDISFVRLPSPATEYNGSADDAYQRVTGDLARAGFDDAGKKYYVYYQGRTATDRICGVGAGDFRFGPSYAVEYLGPCGAVATDAVGAHELLHALGALPAGAPNACTVVTDPNHQADPGHPCDNQDDVLFPVTHGQPLSQLYLDYNHDDYYAHSGSWDDIQDSLWMHRLDAPQQPLTVVVVGRGTVKSDIPGVDCAVTCTTAWDADWDVSLQAVGSPTTRFVGWRGPCAGTFACPLTLSHPVTVTAVFGPKIVPVHVSVSGRGRVSCSPRCSARFRAGTLLTLVAEPATGWRFTGWTGACRGSRPVCRPKTDFAVAAHATFRKR